MGVVSDAIDALEDWCCDLFKDGIKSQFDGISDLLTDTFSQTTGSDGLVSTFITNHPSKFTGGGTGGTAVWTTIETLCNNVVVPIGGFILTVILLNELIGLHLPDAADCVTVVAATQNAHIDKLGMSGFAKDNFILCQLHIFE